MDIIPLQQARAVFGHWVFPPEGQNATVVFEAAQRAVNPLWADLPGERSLEIQGQALVMANNADLRYVFRGISVGKQYAVYVTFPLQSVWLPSAENPAQNTNPQALQPLPAGPTNV